MERCEEQGENNGVDQRLWREHGRENREIIDTRETRVRYDYGEVQGDQGHKENREILEI